MAKHLIYMGFNGVSHRVAKFDDENFMVKFIPIKDTPVLPDAPFLNCTVVNGKAVPNLKGVKVAMTHGRGESPSMRAGWYGSDYTKADDPKLMAFPKKKPEYNYAVRKSGNDSGHISGVTLLSGFSSFNFWDGSFSENNVFVVAVLSARKNSRRGGIIPSTLCITSSGEVWYLHHSDMSFLNAEGLRFIQAGTPVLKHKYKTFDGFYYAGEQPVLSIPDDLEDTFIWQGRKDKRMPTDCSRVEVVCWKQVHRVTICDLRKYPNAKVFGFESIPDCSAVIYPESVECIWMSFMRTCPSVRAMYIPSTVETMYDWCVPKRRVKSVTVYSNSPVAQAFAEKFGCKCVPCASAEEFRERYYAATDDEYISVDTAGSIAALAGASSQKSGETRTVMSGVLFTIESKGFEFEGIEKKFPIVPTESLRTPVTFEFDPAPEWNTVADGSDLTNARIRLMVASFTQFYSRAEFDMDLKGWYKHTLGYYNVYLFGTSSEEDYRRSKESGRLPHGFKEGDAYVLVEDAASRQIIHRFKTSRDNIVSLLKYMEALCFFGDEPNGVLRYADKLAVIYEWARQGSEQEKINHGLFNSMQLISYGTKRGKSELIGICQHTGSFATARYTTAYERAYYGNRRATAKRWFPQVNRLSDIKLHAEGTDMSVYFNRACAFNRKGT